MLKSKFKIFTKNSPTNTQPMLWVYNEQNMLIDINKIKEDTYYNTKMPVVGIMGSDIFANSAFGAGVPTSHVLYLKFSDNNVDTLRIDTRVKNFCNWDSIAYFRVTQNSMPTQELTKNSTSYEFNNHILIQR
jgi:hypothetical protein